METLAERYRRTRPRDYDSYTAWAEFVMMGDPLAEIKKDDLGSVIMFSDGSMHRLEREK